MSADSAEGDKLVAELYEVVLTQRYYGVQTVNRWNYLMTGTPAAVIGSYALADALGAIEGAGVYDDEKLMVKIAECQVDDVVFEQLTVLNVYDPTDFYQVPFVVPLTGIFTDEGMAPFISIGFRTSVVRRDVARGTKRLVGVNEPYVSGGGTIVSTLLTNAQALATEMTATQSYTDEGNSLTFNPVIAGKQRYNPATGLPDDDGSAYRYFPDEADQLAKLAQGFIWQLYPTVRSQTSRQYGRGT